MRKREKGCLLYVKRVALAGGDDLLVLLAPVLDDQVDLLLETEEEEHGLLAGHALHVHVVDLTESRDEFVSDWFDILYELGEGETHLENFVPRLESLEGGWTGRLDGGDEDPGLVAAGEPDAHRALLLEGDEAGIGPRGCKS